MKFKVGDKVRIIKVGGLPSCELGKVGVIVNPDLYGGTNSGKEIHTKIDMGRPRRPNEPTDTCWWIMEKNLELAVQVGQQLLFSFMEE